MKSADLMGWLPLDQWIWWLGPATGTLMQSLVYVVAPPYHSRAVTVAEERNGDGDGTL